MFQCNDVIVYLRRATRSLPCDRKKVTVCCKKGVGLEVYVKTVSLKYGVQVTKLFDADNYSCPDPQ